MGVVGRSVRMMARAAGFELSRLPRKESLDLELYLELHGARAVRERRFYNIGAGGFRHVAWTNVDNPSDWYRTAQGDAIGISWDLLSLTPMPVETGSAEIVYSSHTIEHVNDEAGRNVFREAYRILKVGGCLRVTTPNVDLDYRAYRDDDRLYFRTVFSDDDPMPHLRLRPWSEVSTQQMFLWRFAANASTNHAKSVRPMTDQEIDAAFAGLPYEEALRYCVSRTSLETQRLCPGDHINFWNWDKMRRMLTEAGFSRVFRSAYAQSYCPVLRNTRLFDNTVPETSLYVEAFR